MSQGCITSVEEIQSWWEVPAIAHFCSLFRTAFSLPDFEIEVNHHTCMNSLTKPTQVDHVFRSLTLFASQTLTLTIHVIS